MEDLVLTVEQCKHLQELGLNMSDAVFCWRREGCSSYYSVEKHKKYLSLSDEQYNKYIIPTYTLQEVWDKIPDTIVDGGEEYVLEATKYSDETVLMYSTEDEVGKRSWIGGESGEIFKDGAYEMLCFVIKEGYLKL